VEQEVQVVGAGHVVAAAQVEEVADLVGIGPQPRVEPVHLQALDRRREAAEPLRGRRHAAPQQPEELALAGGDPPEQLEEGGDVAPRQLEAAGVRARQAPVLVGLDRPGGDGGPR
jgi:hypothetical protein